MFTTGAAGSLKSMVMALPTAQAVWSIRPQGLPKKTFSAYWLILAISTASSELSLYSPLKMAPTTTSKAAELDRPEPRSTELVV